MMTIVLIDSCGFTYYRVTATISWFKRAHPDQDITNPDFLGYLESQYLKHLSKIEKITGVSRHNMFLIRDCPIADIWRRKHYSKYKQNRLDKASSEVGPYIRHLNDTMITNYCHVFRINEAEADDVITILSSFIIDTTAEDVIIVGNDSDYDQLHSKRIRILNPKSMLFVDPNPDSLESKVINGDKTDNVPRIDSSLVTDWLRNKQLVDLLYVPRYIQDRVLLELSSIAPLLSWYNHESPAMSYYAPKNVQLGLCCLHTMLRDKNKPSIFCSRTMRLATIDTKGLDVVYERSTQNCRDLISIIKHIARNDGIRVLRISSEIFPHKSNPKAPNYSLDFVRDLLNQAGKTARKYKVRLTFHPGQYNVVGTPHRETFEKTILDLDWHAEVLDLMGCDQDSVMVVHGGGLYNNKAETLDRWCKQYKQLPERVQRRLVLENCEKCFNIEDCLYVSERTGVPVVFDTHHYNCYNIMHPKENLKPAADYIPQILETWNKRSIKPKFHVSEQRVGSQIGSHSDMIDVIPDYLFNIDQPIDIMIEAKLKEQAIHKLYITYPMLEPRPLYHKPNNDKIKVQLPSAFPIKNKVTLAPVKIKVKVPVAAEVPIKIKVHVPTKIKVKIPVTLKL